MAGASACDPSSHKAFDKAAIGISIGGGRRRYDRKGTGVGVSSRGDRI